MPVETIKYGVSVDGFYAEFGKVDVSVDRSRTYNLLDQMEDFYGHRLYEKRIDVERNGRATLTLILDADAWVDREDRADRAERMLKWLVLKLSAEELRYLNLVPRTADPASYSAEQLISMLDQQFDFFERAHKRLTGSRER